MARALTGYGEYHSLAENLTRHVPRTHPEKMALAAGVLLEVDGYKPETKDAEADQTATKRRIGTRALEGSVA
jgi:hypothetical protein